MAVSQAPAVSEALTGVTPVAGGASSSALPSAVQDLARFFLNLAGSSSLGAVGGVAGVAASAAGSVVQLCPSTAAGGAVALGAATAIPAGVGGPPAASAAVPDVSGLQQCQEDSRSHRCRSRSSSDGTGGCVKKRPKRRSPSPGPSSRRRERHYRASSSSSEEDQADASPPRTGRAPGGTPGDFRSSRALDSSPHPGTSRSPGFARAAGSSRSSSDALSAVASEGALVSRVRPSLSSGGFATGSETGSVLVDGEGPSLGGGSMSRFDSGHRRRIFTCIRTRLARGGALTSSINTCPGCGPTRRSCSTSIFSK